MSEAWKQWEGRVVDGKFPLRQFLGSSEHSAVFLTERGEPAQKAAIKFIQVEPSAAELQLSRWKRIAQLSHPHLLRLFECGRCRIADFNLLYVVMEHANENLAEFLPQRPLTPAETRDVLAPALLALGYLHREGLVHGRIQPSNILAIDDRLKLSSDSASPVSLPKAEQTSQTASAVAIGDLAPEGGAISSSATLRRPSPYCAPEAVKGTNAREGDIWALGVTLIEALTQRAPSFDNSSRHDPVLPETLSALFLDIVRNCLRRDPKARWTVAQIQHRLDPTAAPTPAPAPAVAPPVSASATSAPATLAPAVLAADAIPSIAVTPAVLAPLTAPPAALAPAASSSASLASAGESSPSSISASLPNPTVAPPPAGAPNSLMQMLVGSSAKTGPSSATATAPARVTPPPKPPAKPAPSQTQPYHIPAARPPMTSYSARGDAKHHEIGLPKLKQPPLLPIPKPVYFFLGVVLGLLVIGLIGVRILGRHARVQQQTASVVPQQPVPQKPAPSISTANAKGKAQPKSAQKTSAPPAQPGPATQVAAAKPSPAASTPASAQPAVQQPVKAAAPKQVAPAASPSVSQRAAISTTPTPAPTPVSTDVSTIAGGRLVHGEVLNQVLPDVSDKARSTIWGTVRVGVKVHVDNAGNVVAAELNSPGPSKFFADKALEAAKNWDFVPAKLDGHNVPSDWIIRFHFTQSDTRAYPAEETP